MDKKVMIGIIAVVAVVAIVAVAVVMMNNNNSDPSRDGTVIAIKPTFSVGDTQVMHMEGNMGGLIISEDATIEIIAVNEDKSYQVKMPDEDGEESVIKTMTWKEISDEIAPSIDELNKKIKEETGKDIKLKKTGTETLKTIFGDIKCDKYEVNYSEDGASAKYAIYLDTVNGIVLKLDAEASLGVFGSFTMHETLKSSKLIGVIN